MTFASKILILPGLGNSDEHHWQSVWEQQFPEFERVHQLNWDMPHCSDWIDTLDKKIVEQNTEDVILVGHSLACATIAFWAQQYNRKIKGALLVAPSDTEAKSYPQGTTGFTPMPVLKLPFNSITVASTNDFYVTLDRASYFANAWGSKLAVIGAAGHINTASGFGAWPKGLEYLKQLDKALPYVIPLPTTAPQG